MSQEQEAVPTATAGENPPASAQQERRPPPLPKETLEAMGNIRNCVIALYILAILRLLLDPEFFLGALFELITAVVGTGVLREEPTIAQGLEAINARINCQLPAQCKQIEGARMLEVFISLCLVGAIVDVRHTWCMRGADASSIEIFRPVIVYFDAFTYTCAAVLTLQLRCAGWRSHTGVNYNQVSYANSQVQHASSASDSEEEAIRRAMQASLAEAAGPAAPTLGPAAGDAAREDADLARAMDLSRQQSEEANRQLEEVRRKRQENFRAQMGMATQ